jgi:tetratricopeptide (TPR) repeat protein
VIRRFLNPRPRPTRSLLLIAIAVLLLAAGAAYVWTITQLFAARAARRNDFCSQAESQLSACWRLPGLRPPIELEQALLGVQQGDLAGEDAWRARVTPQSPDRLLILEALAKGSLATFRWNEARAYADAILQGQPDHAQGLWLRGRAWIRVQQEDKALEDLQSAMEHDPASVEVRLTLAELLHKQGHVRQAEAHYEFLRSQRPDDARVVLGLAHCRQEDGELKVARLLLDELLKKQPKLVAALIERGRLALRLRQPDDGERWLRQAVALCPDHPDSNFVLQLCLEAQERDDEELRRRIQAAERFQASLRPKLRTTPHDPAVLCEVGRWMQQSGQPEQAVGWFFLALREDPRYAPAHATLADSFADSGQPRRSLAHRQVAGKTGVKSSTTKSAPSRRYTTSRPPPDPLPLPPLPPEATSQQVHDFCGACHAYPPPESMPRAAWRKEVKQGFDLWRDSKLAVDVPPLEGVVLYYENRAPERLPLVEQPGGAATPTVSFKRKGGGWLSGILPFPGVADVNLVHLFDPQKLDLLACDTRIDRVMWLRPDEPSLTWQLLGEVLVPSHTAVTDLDGDGHNDILVASLGQFFPTDDKVGSVVWLRDLAGGTFEPVMFLEGVGRVADVEVADFNGDGRLDLVVAVFGWRRTGEIMYLENRTTDWSHPAFVPHRLDARHGAIHVPVVDLNRDGRPDFVALISQEHETVVAFLNQGDGRFRQESLFTAPHPSYGSSGIQVVDLDGDGDHDVLLTNGDVLDRPYLLKPYHGVQWLENEGTFPFTHHTLAPFYGASRAIAADLDGDRDLDIIAVSFLPRLEFPDRDRLRLPSVLLLEQTEPRRFSPHVLETAANDHFCCAAGDWDGDGRIDLAIGNFSWKRSQPIADAVTLWKNLGTNVPSR